MFTSILEYLANNKAILVGASATLAEIAVIVFNAVRKIKNNRDIQIMNCLYAEERQQHSGLEIFLWSINPINIFRKP